MTVFQRAVARCEDVLSRSPRYGFGAKVNPNFIFPVNAMVDCSGLMVYGFNYPNSPVTLPQGSMNQVKIGKPVTETYALFNAGCLAFNNGVDGGGHVSIMVGDGKNIIETYGNTVRKHPLRSPLKHFRDPFPQLRGDKKVQTTPIKKTIKDPVTAKVIEVDTTPKDIIEKDYSLKMILNSIQNELEGIIQRIKNIFF